MRKRKSYRLSIKNAFFVVLPVLFALNLAAAFVFPGYRDSVSNNLMGKLSSFSNKGNMLLLRETSGPAANQAGINIQKTKENAKAAKAIAEGEPGDSDAGSKPAAAAEPAKKSGKVAKKKKAAPVLDPVMLKKALEYFQKQFEERDVIMEGQEDKEKPYISKAWRDNPFDEVQEIDINVPKFGQGVAPPPYYPPKEESRKETSAEEFQKYVRTIKLEGVVLVNDKFNAFITSGSKKYIRSAGSEYKDKFNITVNEVSLDGVVISDEFGNKGLLEFSYRMGYEVMPIDNTLYITNLGV